MKEPWLVQTGKFKRNVESPKTIDDLVELKYMGAAEFEVELVYENGKNELKNPLFLSIKRMARFQKEYEFVKMLKRKDSLGNQMYIYCKKEDIEECKEYVRKMVEKESCKRATLLPKYYNLSRSDVASGKYINFWWDIKNDFFIFFGDDKIEMLKNMFTQYEERFHDEFYPPSTISKIKDFLKKSFGFSLKHEEWSTWKQFKLFGIVLWEKSIAWDK